MIVTELIPSGKTKVKVFLDYEFAFVLTSKQIRFYGIEEGHQITDALYAEIIEDFVLPKAKLKAMDLLKSMDRTEFELRKKLVDAGFSEQITLEAIEYVKKFNYVNDYRYACNYIRYKKDTKSLVMLKMELKRKGIENDMISKAVEEEYQADMEEDNVRREVKKKCKSIDDLTYEKKVKISAYLYRKGYSSSIIRKVLGDLELFD